MPEIIIYIAKFCMEYVKNICSIVVRNILYNLYWF